MRRIAAYSFVAALLFGFAGNAQATILTFEVFDSDLNFLPYNDPGVQPTLTGSGYLEGFGIPSNYGDNVTGGPGSFQMTNPLDASQVFGYGTGAEGSTPNVTASYGPYSIFTGGPSLWREGYGDLNGVLYQGSRGSVGTDYNILDVVLVADAGYDVILHDFDLGGFFGDHTINAVAVYGGVPFPFLTPTNFLVPPMMSVTVPGTGHATLTYNLQSPVIWLRIDANNLGGDSEFIGIDNIRFSQIASNNTTTLDPAVIDAAFQGSEVPEPASLTLFAVGGGIAAAVARRRRKKLSGGSSPAMN